MTLKSISVIFIFFSALQIFSLPAFSLDYWIRQQTPTTNRISNCFFINNNTGWATGDSGLVMKSTDSGVNWTLQNSNTYHDIYSVYFLNERLGWATAWVFNPLQNEYPGTLLLKTTNSGINWISQMYPDTNSFFSPVFYLDSLNGFLGGSPQFIVYTTNNGLSWNNAVSDSVGFNGFPINYINFLNSDTGFACGGVQDLAGIVWKSVNKGRNWAPTAIGPDALNDMYFFDPDTSIALSGDFKFGASFYRSNNNWLSSFNVNLGYVGMAQSIDFRIRNDGWITIGYLSKLFRSTNAGNNWTKMDIPDSSAIFDIQFLDSTHGWCVGDHGAVYKYDLMTSIKSNQQSNFISSFNLSQNYPNPFNPVTKISFEIPYIVNSHKSSYQTHINVYDILGNEIKTLVNGMKPPGKYDLIFDGSGVSGGIYFYTLTIDGKLITSRSMILLK